LVRQVFATLVKEEFLVVIPRSGFYVREITKKEVKKIYNIRKILESYATKLAVLRISKRDIDELEELFKKAKKDLDHDEAISFIERDARLHRLLIDNSGNEYLKK
jgi:DNA-binding GntR family transcriptional regulator